MRGGTSGLAVAHYREANEQEGPNSVHRVAERRGGAAGRGGNIESPLVGGGCKFMIFKFSDYSQIDKFANFKILVLYRRVKPQRSTPPACSGAL